jgi:hypothetical protein
MSDYLETQFSACLMRTSPTFAPASTKTRWVSLHTASPGETAGGAEVTGGSYARKQLDASDANWTAISQPTGTQSNAVAITFVAATASWGTVTDFGIWDASTAGNLLTYGSLGGSSQTINSGGTASFAIGAIVLTYA